MTEYNLTPQVVTIARVLILVGSRHASRFKKTFQARRAFGLNIVIALTAQKYVWRAR